MGNTTESLGWVNCPKCGRTGQLQRFKRRYFNKTKWKYVLGRKWYYRVTHYEGNKIRLIDNDSSGSGFRGKYLYTCYLSKQNYPEYYY